LGGTQLLPIHVPTSLGSRGPKLEDGFVIEPTEEIGLLQEVFHDGSTPVNIVAVLVERNVDISTKLFKEEYASSPKAKLAQMNRSTPIWEVPIRTVVSNDSQFSCTWLQQI
jgi:hypothetical protein